ncbi:hypothetical protein NPIL_368651, partial [Nephila pilipes]
NQRTETMVLTIYLCLSENFLIPATANSFDPLQQCLTDVTAILNDRQRNLDAAHHDLGRVWLKNRNQTITTEVTVTVNGHLAVVRNYGLGPKSPVPERHGFYSILS